ncbi:MAG: sulfatase-like hydrolase/transferase [Akkermansiaceae bacterium]|nr:sulfatase-like hydrolase/transferase [Akkermansiaceae bacterium]
MNFPKIIFTILLGSMLSLAAARKPNFVIIFTDDQGYQDLGCFGSPDISTPNIDRMAAEGTRFTSFYAQTICGPSRTALMTSSYPLRVAQDKNRCEIHPVVHSKEITIAEVLKPQGYKSAVFGKWDLATHSQKNWIDELLPRGQGFDYFFGTPTSNDSVVHLLRNEEVIERKADMSTLTQRYTDEALKFIEHYKDSPFFVYLAHTMPHTKLAVSKEFKGRSKGGFYGDVIEEIDHNTGRVLKTIKDLGLDDNTYVIFTSDNGPWLLRKAHGGNALPLRSGKTTCWEGGLRVPFVIRAPGKIPAGKTNDLLTATIDLMPSIAKLAGAKLPTDRVLDGIDISKVWHGTQHGLDRPYFYYQHFYLRGVRKGDWKLMLKHEEGPKSFTANWRNHVAAKDSKPLASHQLFNLKEDVGETTNLAKKHPDKLAELLKLAEWARNDIGDYNRLGKNARFFDPELKRIACQTAAKTLPDFSWDTIPRYMHVRKTTAFTPDEIKHLATFPLITFEKATGIKEFGSTERGTEMAAKAVKQINPDSKILYYRNIFVHYDCYAADEQLKLIEAPFLADTKGNTKLIRNRVPGYDLSNTDLQDWWLASAQAVCASDNIDGLFIDGNIKALEKNYLRGRIGTAKRGEIIKSYHQMMTRLPKTLGKNELIIGNTIRARFPQAGLEHLGYFDGSYIEGFEHTVKGVSRKDYVAKGISAIQKAARSGKIIAFTIGVNGYADTEIDVEKTKTKHAPRSFQDRFDYALALFLICAEKHSYFMFIDGYGVDGNQNRLWMKDLPEYSKPLGPPKGPATQNGYLYQRSFEKAEVTIDIDKETANITWTLSK